MTGVGGQGVILMSELLGKVAVAEGLKVRGSEVLGMAVRGGSVVSIIRMGTDVYGPLVPAGKGDVLLGMEPAEALRYATFLSASGLAIVNTRKVIPFTATLGEREYPSMETIIGGLRRVTPKVVTLDATGIAEESGSSQAANIVMLGALFATGRMPVKADLMKEALRARFPARLAPINLKSFEMGYETCRNAIK